MTKGIYKRKARRVGKRRGGGSKMNTCLKRAQRATIRPMLHTTEVGPDGKTRIKAVETAAQMRVRVRREMEAGQ